MNEYTLYIAGSFLISMVCGFVLIPYIIRYCIKHKLYDQPDARKVHSNKIPRLGGVCFLPSMVLALIIGIATYNNMSVDHQVKISLWSCFFFISLMLIYIIGLLDDLNGLSAMIKFIVQIAAASLLPLAGLYINNLYGLMGIHEIPYWIGAPLTVFVIVFINNAMNLIDGIDGLSASLSLLALGGFLYFFLTAGVWVYSTIIAGLMGVIVAFLYFNVLGKAEKNLKIFMGDSGSLTIGFILGFLFVKYSMARPDLLPFRSDAMVSAYTLLIVPVFDVIRMILLRIMHRCPIFGADKNHIHHKLMRTGMNQHQTLAVLIALAVFYVVLNMTLSFASVDVNVVVVADIIVWILFHLTTNHFIRCNNEIVFHQEK